MRRSSGRARVAVPVRAKKPSLCEELSDKCEAQRRIIDWICAWPISHYSLTKLCSCGPEWATINIKKNILLMSVIYGGRQSCMIDVIYCGCPSLMNMMDVHHVWHMDASHICMMYVHHIWCFTVINFHHICERSLWWKQWNLLVGGMNWKDMVNFETIDQGIDETKEKIGMKESEQLH